jgi:hypothetical protein
MVRIETGIKLVQDWHFLGSDQPDRVHIVNGDSSVAWY